MPRRISRRWLRDAQPAPLIQQLVAIFGAHYCKSSSIDTTDSESGGAVVSNEQRRSSCRAAGNYFVSVYWF
jgi:hypothetical protein